MHVCVCFFYQYIFIIQSDGFCDVFNQVYHVLQSDLLITLSCDEDCFAGLPSQIRLWVYLFVCAYMCVCMRMCLHACLCMCVHVKNLDYTHEQKHMDLSGPGFSH